jgi:Inorganic pyrophosphatase
VFARPIALLDMADEHGNHPHVVCVAVADPGLEPARAPRRSAAAAQAEIEHFFAIYKTSTQTGTRACAGGKIARRHCKRSMRRADGIWRPDLFIDGVLATMTSTADVHKDLRALLWDRCSEGTSASEIDAAESWTGEPQRFTDRD